MIILKKKVNPDNQSKKRVKLHLRMEIFTLTPLPIHVLDGVALNKQCKGPKGTLFFSSNCLCQPPSPLD